MERDQIKAGIVIDSWKLSIFERRLSEAGYNFKKAPGLTDDTILLKVKTKNVEALSFVVRAANTEAAQTGATK